MKDRLEHENENLHDEYLEDFREVILTLEDDTELKCLIIAQYEVNDKDYIALLPINGDDSGEVLLYRATYGEDETFDVSLIEDEEEFEKAADAYYSYIEEEELDMESIENHYHEHHCEDGQDCGCHNHHKDEGCCCGSNTNNEDNDCECGCQNHK